jgi:hypothetical protein
VRHTRLLAILGVTAIVAVTPGTARASWSPAIAGSGSAVAFSMPTAEAPSVTVTDRDLVVSWAEAVFPNGIPVDGYIVSRYGVPDGTPEIVGAGCDGTIASLSCTERAVPPGRWTYTVTPVHGDWTGPEGPASADATVGGAGLVFSSSTTLASLPATLDGDLSGFEDGESVEFRLDDPATGAMLSGAIAPDPVPGDGAATVTVTIPAGTGLGAHTVYAIGSVGSTAGAGITVVDTVPPLIEAAVILKAQGGTPGYLSPGGTYFVYANVTDPDPSSAVASVSADVSAFTGGLTEVELTAGSYPVAGTTYGYRSAELIAATPLTAGATTFSVTAVDTDGNTGSVDGFSVTVDDTSPSALDVQATNVGGGTAGRLEAGDRLTLTFSEPVEPDPILAGWTGTATTVTVRLGNGQGGSERIQVWDATNTLQLPIGTIVLGRNDYANGAVSFGNSMMVMSGSQITITFGTPSRSTRQAAGAGTMTWTPTTLLHDWAGNLCLTTPATESGAADVDF